MLERIEHQIKHKQGGRFMNINGAARALEALDEIRGLLQAAQFAARKFEQMGTQHPLETTLHEHIHRAKKAADGMRARIQLSVRITQSRSLLGNGA